MTMANAPTLIAALLSCINDVPIAIASRQHDTPQANASVGGFRVSLGGCAPEDDKSVVMAFFYTLLV
jgi:hypothetical protein